MRINRIEKLIGLLREIDPPYVVDLFTNGGCFHLWRILRVTWPRAWPWWSQDEHHVYVRIARNFYDIRGRCANPPNDIRRMWGFEMEEALAWLPNRLRDGCRVRGHKHARRSATTG